jgi:hypothetical protein
VTSLEKVRAEVVRYDHALLAHSQFPWTFQRYLYDCMHDYLVELFLRTPQIREVRA